MLNIAISLEVIASAAMFGLGGVALGLSVLGLTLLLTLLSMATEQRQLKIQRARKVWTYFAVNDRLGTRACIRSRRGTQPLAPAVDASRLAWIAAMGSQGWRRSLDRN